ncbi:MAG: BMP family ABC transporter substrate-binding protein [Lachnospiraceae bacterium]|nr:BMP family ABC transporter substrate-binding protein [Lachnospiraceae bacterium]
MKKLVALFMCLVMCLSLFTFAGCDKKDDDIKVGAIYITSKDDTSGYTYAHHNGITTAMKNLGISTEDNLFIIDNVAEDYTAVTNAIDTLAGKGCDIIFGISFGYIDAMADAAEKEEYKDIIFSHGTGYKSNETNFNNYFGRIYQARYLSGIAAGLKSLELGNNNIGYVAAWGTEYAETCSGINAFALGAQAVNPNAEVHVKVISTWGDEALEKQAAELLVNTYNCGVITQHCDSAQPQMVAENATNVFGCGYNSDMTAQAPTSHLTAPVWNWYVYYQLAIETAMNKPADFMKTVGNYYGGLKEDFVDVSPLTANCSKGTAEMIKLARDLMVNGEWDVFSGVKLSFTESNGTYSVVKTNADLKDNAGNVIVAAGGASVEDSVIQGSMNYYVEGVTAE